MRISIIIPTYNEEKSISQVMTSLQREFLALPQHEFSIIVVDGNSKDGTAAVVKKMISENAKIHLIEETSKEGIAAAYLKGMNYAIDTVQADAYVEFDGDGQHDPKYLADMVKAFDEGFDYVIGSRYVPGGNVPAEWSSYRKFLSRVGGLYAKFVLDLPINDPTSGLKLSRIKGCADHISRTPEKLLSRHYAYKLQLLFEMIQFNAKVKEIPIQFALREFDESKSTPRDIFESLRVVTILRLKHLTSWKVFRIGIIGIIGLIIQTLVFEVIGLKLGILKASTATIVGGELAILSNFFLNNKFTFQGTQKVTLHKILKFHLVSLGSILIQFICVFTTEHLTSNPAFIQVAYFSGIILGFISNYIGYTFFVWKKD